MKRQSEMKGKSRSRYSEEFDLAPKTGTLVRSRNPPGVRILVASNFVVKKLKALPDLVWVLFHDFRASAAYR
jgi:hypothetical protein